MEKYWDFPSISTHKGPRSFEVPYVLHNIQPGSIFEIGANKSLLKWAIIRMDSKYVLIDPLGTLFRESKTNENITCLTGDIRKRRVDKLGQFENVILMSTLEHIGLPGYRQKEDWHSWGSARQCQLKTFEHCMSFVSKKGRMICTLPYANTEGNKNPNLIRYSREMVNDLQNGFKVRDESFFVLENEHLDRWRQVEEKETKEHRSNICFVLEK